ncbi:MAG: 3-hydroxyacyl-ACP dehydratase FabZ [Rhodospirillaceae bacterium]|jgi:3-hydroxyacyl-[acyl-carrier-protein] dehydratase|nr:3-hydroxyacyl-ACP dehydratase FabZ [Rhodospirillaceae bacterium]MBT6138551.1 3-hydroxyacyl-ACP dehydratase FabZ [Rhodospirillaceae bacterium]
MNDISETRSEAPSAIDVDIHRIMELIPHRYPFLLVDRLQNMVPGERAVGIKNVTMNEPYFVGHFPTRPVMPGVMIVECMAQTAGCVVVASLEETASNKLVYFMTVENARFRRPVTPGDQLRVHVEKLRSRGNVWKFTGKAYVEEALVAEATFSAMIADET